MMDFQPSRYQKEIFDWVKNGEGDSVVEAMAGSGKTSSALKAMEVIPRHLSVLFLAFNKSIAQELSSRAPSHADVKTLNSLGHRTWTAHVGQVNLIADKTQALISEALTSFEIAKYGSAVRSLVGLAKSQGIVPTGTRNAQGLKADTDKEWANLLDHYDIAARENLLESDQMAVINLARLVVTKGFERPDLIDYDDQIFMPVAMGVYPNRYDWVFVDEAQDLSPVQWALVEMAKKEGGRIMAIGDPRQAIYSWRGADADSMANFKKRSGAHSLQLSICYRCPKSHIALVQKIVPEIEASDSAGEGIVHDHGSKWNAGMFEPTDLIICRNSGPLVRAAYRILAQKVAVRILGRDLGVGLVKLIRKLKAKDSDDLVDRLDAWYENEINRLFQKDPDASSDKIDDKYETISTFIEMFPDRTPDEICREIDALYNDRSTGILTLCTVHKAKGLESERVFILNRSLMPARQAKKPWQVQAEANIEYVALSRSRHYLGFIDIDTQKNKRQ